MSAVDSLRARAGLLLALAVGAVVLGRLLLGLGGGVVYWLCVFVGWAAAAALVSALARLADRDRTWGRAAALAAPVVFGATLLLLWEAVVRGANVPTVLLPPPSMVFARLISSPDILWADFQQTFMKSVLIGYGLGCGSAFVIALLIDRSEFLQRGLLPVGNFVAALPIVGVAPIMVMWFGFDWPSKAAVVVVMVFFPVLVNTVEGLKAADRMQRDLMRTWAATPRQELLRLRLPMAAPFIFNGLKIASTLALIGAIVAEFFGTPVVGMGFRISTEVGRMNVDMVWAEIAVAAVAGSAFYWLVSQVERWATFWHPSQRR